MASERQTELRIVAMPSGRDPADIVTQDGPDAFRGLLDGALNVWSFQLGRMFEQADLGTAEGKDRAFDAALPLIREAPRFVREELIRDTQNALGIGEADITAALASRPAPTRAPATESEPRPVPVRPISQVERAERVFLSLCLGGGERGREYLERSTPEHFATDLMREARQHLLTHTGDPLGDLSMRDKSLSSAVMEIVQMADEGGMAEQALRLSYLQMELRRWRGISGRRSSARTTSVSAISGASESPCAERFLS